MPYISRRNLLGAACGLALPGVVGKASAAPISGLEILAAPTAASVVLAQVFESGALHNAAPDATFRLWRTTDDLRAAIVSGRTKLFSTPTHVPANLANRGLPLKLLAILGMGHLSVVTADPKINSFHDLAAKPVLGFFQHDMPDLVFRSAAKMEGLNPDKDISLSYVQSGMEAAQMLAAGRADTAILSEPMATSAIAMAASQGRTLHRAVLLNEVWARHKSRSGIPMVGLAVHADLVEKSPEIIAALRVSLRPAAARVLADKKVAAELAARTMGFPAQMFQNSIDHSNIQVRGAREAKADLIDFYRTLLDTEPQALGGKLPADDFFLDL
jgi:NitT/TauT family transport system substrate-binding protein